jgi:molybdopterin-guanine dinucleotide biosynthesis protein A
MKSSAALFAGGESRRMGMDKADVVVEGIPLWQKQVAVLRETGVDEIFVSGCNRPDWRDAGLVAVEDEMSGGGPLAGLVATLRRTAHPLLLVLAVDMPAMTSTFLKQLVESAKEQVGVVPMMNSRYEPLAAVYPVAALTLAEACLTRGHLSLQEFTSSAVAAGLVKEHLVATHERALFFNLNTPADLAAYTAR